MHTTAQNRFKEPEPPELYFVKECENDKRAEFIINCARAANPMSDEEGEDLIKQCDATSVSLYCKISISKKALIK